jgi:signal transduction histidine kinase
MRRFRPHRTAALVLGLLVAASWGASGIARQVVEDNEAQLLVDKSIEIRGLLESLGSGYEAEIAAVAAIAQFTEGDMEQFRRAVAGVDADAATSTTGGWALVHRKGSDYQWVGTLGAPTAQADVPADWVTGLATASSGKFTVLGFLGEGYGRRFAMAMGQPGGEYIVYTETSLVAETASASADVPPGEESPISGVAVQVFVGSEPDPEKLLITIGTPDPSKEVRQSVDVAGAELVLVVSPTGPLGGSLAGSLPNLLLGGGVIIGLLAGGLFEVMQRRRDDAVSMIRDLESQNRLLDEALREQQATEKARAELEVELRQSQRLEAIGQLAGGVAHDFNNILAAILSYADLAADGVTDSAVRADLESIQQAARRGAGLTRKLLTFSRRRAGEVSLIDVNERVTDIVSMLGRTLGDDVALRTSLEAHPAAALADPVEIDQVLVNLVVNARDAMPSGGTIVISTQLVDLDLDAVDGVGVGRHVRLAVTDDGSGMTPSVIAQAFDPFFTTKGRGEGTGLGLSTVYGIVQRMGGRVSAHSVEGEGTTIEVLLPASDKPLTHIDHPSDRPVTEPGTARTVLVVEDEEPLRRAIGRMLERAGFLVSEAPDGATALDVHRDSNFDVLLTDVVMPGGVTGVGVADGFRRRHPDLPVVFVTGYSDDILDPERLDGIRTTSLTKPFSEAELLDVLARATGVLT